MTNLLPVAVYGLKVPAGDVMIPASVDFPATFRITMAAIDPSAKPEHTGTAQNGAPLRATLKMVYDPSGPGSESDSEEENDVESFLKNLDRNLVGNDDSEDDDEDDSEEGEEIDEEEDPLSSSDEDVHGGPSDLSKSKKARKEAAAQQLLEALANLGGDESDDEMEVDKIPKANGLKTKGKDDKGKAKALEQLKEGDALDDEEEFSTDGLQEIVVCTLDLDRNYQQTLDLTIPEDQNAFFKVSGNYAIYLTGNYVIPHDQGSEEEMYDDEDTEDDYKSDSEDYALNGEESDELDDLEDPRITEILSEDDEAVPKLVKKATSKEEIKKGKNKRPAEDAGEEPVTLDDIMAKALKPEDPQIEEGQTLSKKQLKKLKKNDGKAAPTTTVPEVKAENTKAKKDDVSKDKTEKKVSFAKNLEQPKSSPNVVNGNSKSEEKTEGKRDGSKETVKYVQGVKIDDRKIGKGPVAKNGSRVGMRYIGKLQDGKVFDANKKGPSFKFKIGDGSVIKGWDIGVAGMAVGGERRITIPPHLAYGKKKLPQIPANSELQFDVKLLEIL